MYKWYLLKLQLSIITNYEKNLTKQKQNFVPNLLIIYFP